MITTDRPTEVELPRVAATPTEFVQWLNGFGHPDALARWLHDHGVTGIVANAQSCPLARVAQHSLDEPRAAVGVMHYAPDLYTAVRAFLTNVDGIDEEGLPLPRVAGAFVQRFDLDEYPELINQEGF